MDLKDPKFQKLALGVVVLIIALYFWYTRIYSSQANQIETKQAEYETMITNLRNVEMKAKSLDALKVEYEDFLVKYREIEQLLPEVKMVPSFLVQLHTASSLTGTKITSIKPKPVHPESFYNVASFEVEMVGGYHEFGKFISYIANFPFIVNVDNMKIQALEVAKTGQHEDQMTDEEKNNTVKARFILSTYYVKESERLKGLEIEI
jgi:type IV pilus assembly protein PilO